MGACCSVRVVPDGGFLTQRNNGGAEDSSPLTRHRKACGAGPSLLVYSIANLPGDPGFELDEHSQCHFKPERRRPVAEHVPPNAHKPVPIETHAFVGSAVWMQKVIGDDAGVPYAEHFKGRRRRWELRLQGRFKRKPKGQIFLGIILKDFNYNQAVAGFSKIIQQAGLRLLNGVYTLYMNWGSRCEESYKPEAELAHCVTGASGWDQVIITKRGEKAPDITGKLEGLGFQRTKMGLRKYTQELESIFTDVDLTDTFTLGFWGVSQFIDLANWEFDFKVMRSDMTGLFQQSPIHVCMYEILPDRRPGEARHFEDMKRYYLDFMFWSTRVDLPHLAERYEFKDAPREIEEACARRMNGKHVVVQAKSESSCDMEVLLKVLVLAIAVVLAFCYSNWELISRTS